MTTQCW